MFILQLVIQLHVRIVSWDGLWLENILLNLGVIPIHHKIKIVHQLFKFDLVKSLLFRKKSLQSVFFLLNIEEQLCDFRQ